MAKQKVERPEDVEHLYTVTCEEGENADRAQFLIKMVDSRFNRILFALQRGEHVFIERSIYAARCVLSIVHEPDYEARWNEGVDLTFGK